jgi:hypothetical protein
VTNGFAGGSLLSTVNGKYFTITIAFLIRFSVSRTYNSVITSRIVHTYIHKVKKVKISLLQAMEAHRVARG